MIKIDLLPARFGDCILIEYGDGEVEHRILIDAGLKATYKEALLPRLEQIGTPVELDLLVVTHIDRDHICGVLPLLSADPAVVAPKDVWFNGREHLDDTLGPADGEALSQLLQELELPWNKAFRGKAVVVPDSGKLPVKKVGGAKLTLLSPYRANLDTLAEKWDDTLGNWDSEPEEGKAEDVEPDDVLGKSPPLEEIDVDLVSELQARDSDEDDTAPNGSSIAFLFEYEDKKILFAADAFPSVLLRSLERYSDKLCELAAFKLSHHGSKANLSPELLAKISCDCFLVSSNGDSYGHPNPEAIARIIATPNRTICCNYLSDYTKVWNDRGVRRKFKYKLIFPNDSDQGLVIEI